MDWVPEVGFLGTSNQDVLSWLQKRAIMYECHELRQNISTNAKNTHTVRAIFQFYCHSSNLLLTFLRQQSSNKINILITQSFLGESASRKTLFKVLFPRIPQNGMFLKPAQDSLQGIN